MRKLILYSIISLLNLTVLFFVIIFTFSHLYKTFLYLTILSFTLSTFYLTTMWIYEIRLHLNKNNPDHQTKIKECRYYRTMRERVFKFVFTIEVTVCVGYWWLCLGGESIMVVSHPIYFNLYVHFFIGLQLVLELLLTERNHHPQFFLWDYLLAAAIICVYSVFLTFVAKSFKNMTVYPFLKLALTQILAVNLVLFLISFNVYQFLIFILDRKNKNKEAIQDNQVSFIHSKQSNI